MAAASPASKRAKEEAPAPIIIVKKIVDDHGDHGHHGGAWKVAYADFATAMMAFFMLLWIVGATTEKQRKGIADYFSPTLVKVQTSSSGSNGLLAGRSLTVEDGGAPATSSGQRGSVASILPEQLRGASPSASRNLPDGEKRQIAAELDRKAFKEVERAIVERLAQDASLADLREQVRFVQTREGLRIEILDRAGFSMFGLGTDRLETRATKLISEVAKTVDGMPNPIAIRGHTDSLQYANQDMNNWKLAVYRAEATRAVLANKGIPADRFARLEGVADREPFVADDPKDPRNRRISITLFYRDR